MGFRHRWHKLSLRSVRVLRALVDLLLTEGSLLIGYILAYLSYLPSIHRFRGIRRKHPGRLKPEARLWWLLFCKPSHNALQLAHN
jgi:hypothetical protein